MTVFLTKSALLSAKLPCVDVQVPELGRGVNVRVQQMTVNTRAAFFERIRENRADINAYEDDQDKPESEREGLTKPDELDQALLALVHSIVDTETGDLMFVEADMPLFAGWAFNAVQRVYEAVIKLNDYDNSINNAVAVEKKG